MKCLFVIRFAVAKCNFDTKKPISEVAINFPNGLIPCDRFCKRKWTKTRGDFRLERSKTANFAYTPYTIRAINDAAPAYFVIFLQFRYLVLVGTLKIHFEAGKEISIFFDGRKLFSITLTDSEKCTADTVSGNEIGGF